MSSILKSLQSRNCPVCGALSSKAIPFLDRHIDEQCIDGFSYASRKTPEYMCYKLVRCPICDIVYACESPTAISIGQAYSQASYDSKKEALLAAETYEKTLMPHLSKISDRRGVLDIGTGTGAFLQKMKANGFSELIGIEPSRAAIDAADSDIKPFIREGLFKVANFKPASFSLITCFMTLEHITDPGTLVNDCLGLLKPDGAMVAVVHDWRAWNNRILGRKSPIIDIEHLQLFSKPSIKELYSRAGYSDIYCTSFRNRFQLDYWNRLMPTPSFMKRGMAKTLQLMGIAEFRLAMNVGNLMAIAHK